MSINPDFTSHSLISKYEPSRRNLAKSDEFAVDLAKSDPSKLRFEYINIEISKYNLRPI